MKIKARIGYDTSFRRNLHEPPPERHAIPSVDQARAKREPILSYSEDQENNEVTIEILDEIGGWGVYASEIIPLLRRMDAEGRTIFIRINFPGGDVFESSRTNTASGRVPQSF